MVTAAIQGDVIIGLKYPGEHRRRRHMSDTVANLLCVCVVCASVCAVC